MPATDELVSKLERRLEINTLLDKGLPVEHKFIAHRSIYAEFVEFSRKQIKVYEALFNKLVSFFSFFFNFELYYAKIKLHT